MSGSAAELFARLLDALYPAAQGARPWRAGLETLLLLGRSTDPHAPSLFAAALRHVQHALEIGRQLGTEAHRAATLRSAAGSLPCGLVLLDDRARVLFLSARAEALFSARHVARVQDGRLRLATPAADRELARLLTRLRSARPVNGAACLQACAEGADAPLRLLLLRVAASDPADGTSATPGAVLGLAFSPDDRAVLPDPERLREIYGFSAAEAQLAALLVTGHSLLEAARHRSVTLNTVRTQLKCVLRKTGCRNQADLVRTLIAGPAGLLQGLLAHASR